MLALVEYKLWSELRLGETRRAKRI